MPEKIEGQPSPEDEFPKILDVSKEGLEQQKDIRVKDTGKGAEIAKIKEGENLPDDWLPDGTDAEHYLKEDKEWLGLEERIGQPRILKNIYFQEVFDWIQKNTSIIPMIFHILKQGAVTATTCELSKKS